ncbi:MAG: pantoate--beta-alanine ligase [Kiritimatiellaeota bacterium]|nr:pantoate--beta-alanine ligase [Kiritimatiellota bacterium]
MEVFKTICEIREFSIERKKRGERVGFVPTMGFLHEGHLSLVDEARRHADVVVVSIFVNPTQFGPNEDLDVYPRDFERDAELCESRGVDAIFAPSANEMYPTVNTTWVEETSLTKRLCGADRPTHFRGVTTVVSKLFNVVCPDVAVFGEKDYQQAAVVKKMVADLNFGVEIIVAPIVRESDGLALSSRNKYLSVEERGNALAIRQSLLDAKSAVADGERDSTKLADAAVSRISRAGGRVDYVEIADPDTLEPLLEIGDEAVMLIAAYFGATRLIDNARF